MKRLRLASWISPPPSMILGLDNVSDLTMNWPIFEGGEYRDHLTDLYNRLAYDEAIKEAEQEAARQNASFGLLIFDIDYFKMVNDNHGHSAGDCVLVEFSKRIIQSLRSTDFAVRMGGEEFAVLTTSYKKVFEIGERVRLAVGQAPFHYEDKIIPLTCSFGCAVYPMDGFTQTDVFKRADEALYQAKNEGRNRGIRWMSIAKRGE